MTEKTENSAFDTGDGRETGRRVFLLRPQGGLVPPRTEGPTRLYVVGDVPILRLVLRPGRAVLVARDENGELMSEDVLSPAAAESLAASFPHRQLQFWDLSLGDDWTVRMFAGRHWGIVFGVWHGTGEPGTPDGWYLGKEISGDPRMMQKEMAAQDEEDAAAFVKAFGTRQY